MKLSQLQKFLVIFIGVKTQCNGYINRRVLTSSLYEELNCKSTKENFSSTLTASIKSLQDKGLVSMRGNKTRLTHSGIGEANLLINDIKKRYNTLTWRVVKCYLSYGEL